MPQLTLEYSSNIIEDADLTSLLKKLNQVISEVGNIDIKNFKSRAVKRENFFVGTGSSADAFMHVEFKLLEGRSDELKNKICKTLLELLKENFNESVSKLNLQITVELLDIKKSSYFKHPDNL